MLGLFLYLGFIAQTIGPQYTTASNAGFITGLNCVMAPKVCWLWLRERQPCFVWAGVALATLGTFLLTGGINGFGLGEFWVLVCALWIAVHIVYTDQYAANTDALVLTQVQRVVVILLCAVTASFIERPSIADLPHLLFTPGEGTAVVWVAVLVGGILGTSLAYVAQTVAQQFLETWLGALCIVGGVLVAELVGAEGSSE